MLAERPRSKSIHVVASSPTNVNKPHGDTPAPTTSTRLEHTHIGKSTAAADLPTSAGSKRALTIRTLQPDDGDGRPLAAHSAAPLGRVRVRSSTVSQSGESKSATALPSTRGGAAAGPASAGVFTRKKGLPFSREPGRSAVVATDFSSAPTASVAAVPPDELEGGGRRSSLSPVAKITTTPTIKVKLNGTDTAPSTNHTHVKGRKSTDYSRQRSKFSAVEEKTDRAPRTGSLGAGQDPPPKNSPRNTDAAAATTSSASSYSTGIATRPKSNTITGLAPQLLRAQRAAAEAAKDIGSSRRLSLLSSMSSISASSPSHGPNVRQEHNPPLEQNGEEGHTSFASYSSSDTVFSAMPPLPPPPPSHPPNSVLRSSRSREPISRRMTVSWDTRIRKDSPGHDAIPATKTAIGIRVLKQDAVDDLACATPSTSVQCGLSDRSNDDDDDGDEGDEEDGQSPNALNVIGAAAYDHQAARAAQTAVATECELCGIETGSLTMLLPCCHKACAPCCSSGINQVSTSPPRSHVCAACRTPVESISLPKVIQRGMGGGCDGGSGVTSTTTATFIADTAITGVGDAAEAIPHTKATGTQPVVPSPPAFSFQLDGPQLLSHHPYPYPASSAMMSPAASLHPSQLQLGPRATPGQGAPPPPLPPHMYPAYPSMPMLSPSPCAAAGPLDPNLAMQTETSWNIPSFDPPYAAPYAAADEQSRMDVDSSPAMTYDFTSSTVVRIDNIPWTVSCDDVMKWLPDPLFTLVPKTVCAQAIHIPIDLQNGKTSNACYIMCRDRKAAQRIVRARTNTKLCGRPVTLILTTFNELLDEIFTTRNLSASLDEDRAVYFTDQQLERLLCLLKEGGGQLKDGCKPIEFASSLMSLVPPRLADSQKMSLFNVILDMVNHCLSLASSSPSIRPALDRLLLSCSMCGAFDPEKKLTIIETARAALSALMLSDSMHRKSSPRTRKAAALNGDTIHAANSPVSNHPNALLDSGASPRMTRSVSHLAVAGGCDPALPPAPAGVPPELGSPAQLHFNLAPYATPPYATHDIASHQPPGRALNGYMRPPVMIASARHGNIHDQYYPGGFAAPTQLFTPEYTPYQGLKPLPPPGPPSMAMSAHGDRLPLHIPTPNLGTPICYYPPLPPHMLTVPGGHAFEGSAPQTPLPVNARLPGGINNHNSYFAYGPAHGGNGPMPGTGMLLPPFAYPMGMSPSHSPMPTFSPMMPGSSSAGPAQVCAPHGGNQLGLVHAETCRNTSGGHQSAQYPANKEEATACAGHASNGARGVCESAGDGTEMDEGWAGPGMEEDQAGFDRLVEAVKNAVPAGDGPEKESARDGSGLEEKQAGFDRLVEAVTNAIQQKKDRMMMMDQQQPDKAGTSRGAGASRR